MYDVVRVVITLITAASASAQPRPADQCGELIFVLQVRGGRGYACTVCGVYCTVLYCILYCDLLSRASGPGLPGGRYTAQPAGWADITVTWGDLLQLTWPATLHSAPCTIIQRSGDVLIDTVVIANVDIDIYTNSGKR